MFSIKTENILCSRIPALAWVFLTKSQSASTLSSFQIKTIINNHWDICFIYCLRQGSIDTKFKVTCVTEAEAALVTQEIHLTELIPDDRIKFL